MAMQSESSTALKLTNGFFAFSALGLVSEWQAQVLPYLAWWYLLWFVLTRTNNGHLNDAFGRFLATLGVFGAAPVIIVTIGLIMRPMNSAQALIFASPFLLLSSIYAVYKIIMAVPSSILTVDRPDTIRLSDDTGE